MANNEDWRRLVVGEVPRWIQEMADPVRLQLFMNLNHNNIDEDGDEGVHIIFGPDGQAVQLNRVPVEPPPPRRYPVGSGFPIITRYQFDPRHRQPHEEFGSHKGLEWVVKFTTHEETTGLLIGRATMYFSGMGAKRYMISATCHPNDNQRNNGPDNMILVDKEHCQIVFPKTIHVPVIGGTYGQLVAPETTTTLTVHNIELVDDGVNHEQRWPLGTSWIAYQDLFSVRVDENTLEKASICFSRLMADLNARLLSVEEAQAFYDFACLLFHNSFYGEEKYQEVLKKGMKLGFVQLQSLDLSDSPLDFHTRTMLPNYQLLSVETPLEQVSRGGMINGSCDHFKLKLDRDIRHLRSQVEKMPNFRGGHRGQVSFYLEETNQGTLLLAAVNMLLKVPKLAKMKVALFENRHAVTRYETYRVVNSNQRTICMAICVLTEQQITMMAGGQMAVNIQLHLFPAEQHATHINNIESLEDGTVAHVMPGLTNGWIRCGDGKLIGVCKEHVAHFSGWLSMVFFNHSFIDCGRNTVEVNAPSEIVLDALQIIYHKCHAVHFDRVDLVLELAGFWVSPVIRHYFDVAVWKSSLMLLEDKVRLARKYNLEITTYVLCHPEYHGIEISAELMAELINDV